MVFWHYLWMDGHLLKNSLHKRLSLSSFFVLCIPSLTLTSCLLNLYLEIKKYGDGCFLLIHSLLKKCVKVSRSNILPYYIDLASRRDNLRTFWITIIVTQILRATERTSFISDCSGEYIWISFWPPFPNNTHRISWRGNLRTVCITTTT
jgi:hypothetical protein